MHHESELVSAAQHNNAEEVRRLLAARADVNATSPPFGWTALHTAAGYGSCEACAALLEGGAKADAAAEDGETPLHLAAQAGMVDAIRLLVSHRANLSARSEDGETPLHVGVQHVGAKSLEHIKALIELRASPEERDSSGSDAFAHARVMTNRADELEAVLRQGLPSGDGLKRDSEILLRAACQKGQAGLVRALLRDLSDAPGSAARAMMPASIGGSVEVIEALIAARADVRSAPRDDAGNTMLIAASEQGTLKMVRFLLQHHADVDATSEEGATPLMAACMRGNTEIATALLAARAQPGKQSKNGWTPLMTACHSDHAEVARQLLDARAELDTANEDGSSARSLALASGRSELVKLLDTRAKLLSRRAKAKEDAPGAEDTRDLDALLAGLGEPSKARKSKAQKPEPHKEPTQETQISHASKAESHKAAHQEHHHAESREPRKAAEDPVKGSSGKAGSSAGQKDGSKAESAKTDKAKKVHEAKVQVVRSQLQDVARRRAELDAEEAKLKEQLATLLL